MKKIISALLLLILVRYMAQAQVVVVDEDNNKGIYAASVFNNETGKLVGLTNEQGELPAGIENAQAVTVHHVNYGSKQISVSHTSKDTVRLKALVFNLPEIKVNKDPKMLLRIKTYTRQYSFVDNVPVAISEGIRYLYFKNSDEEKSPKIKTISEKSYVNKEYYESQSEWVQAFANTDSPMFLHINNYKLYDKLKGNIRMTLSDRKGKKMVKYMNEDLKNNTCEMITDSGYVDRPFNLPLFRVSFTNLYINEKYTTKYGKPKLCNLISCTQMLRIIMNKTKKFIDTVDEYYPMEFEYVTKEQMTEQRKDRRMQPFVRPENMPALNPLMEKAMKKMYIKN